MEEGGGKSKTMFMLAAGGGISVPAVLVLVFVILIGGAIAAIDGGSAAAATCLPSAAPLGPGPGGGTTTAEQAQNAQIIIGVGKGKGIPTPGLAASVAISIQESQLLNLSNTNVPGSNSPQYNPEGVGSNDTSLGIFQQLFPSWGTIQELMDPTVAATKFDSQLAGIPNLGSLTTTEAITSAILTFQNPGIGQMQQPGQSAALYAYTKYAGEADSLVSTYASAPPIVTTGPTYSPGTGSGAASCPPTTGTGSVMGYSNPFRSLSPLTPERIDQGVDYCGDGPIYAIGNGTVNIADSSQAVDGWPGGGYVSYTLTGGAAAGKIVYVAEDISPTVTVGQAVTPNTVIAMFNCGADGLETGWASGTGTESLALQNNQWDGTHSTAYGANFSALLQALGAPAGVMNAPAQGALPAGWPSTW